MASANLAKARPIRRLFSRGAPRLSRRNNDDDADGSPPTTASSSSSSSSPNHHHHHHLRRRSYSLILGIETSCDDTGVAIVDTNGDVLAESLYSQSEFHARLGGVNPPIARDLHAVNVVKAVDDVFAKSGLTPADLSAVAATTRPGLALALKVGLAHARRLALDARLPLLPIHHMEAHALTPRLLDYHRDDDDDDPLDFPFLVLLASGGHCILALVRGVFDFLLLGACDDQAPGDLLDKAARRLKLLNLPECRRLGAGGRAVETMARRGDPSSFSFGHVMLRRKDCNFSFSGLHAAAHRLIEREEDKWGVVVGDVLPNAADVAASLQTAVAKHLALRIARAWNYCDLMGLVPPPPSSMEEDDDGDEKPPPRRRRRLVMSGGVASNEYLRSVVRRVCENHDAELICPPPRLCTDNGVMIAWNGVERWKAGDRGVIDEEEMRAIQVWPKSPLGTDVREDVFRRGLGVKAKEIDALVSDVT